MMPSRVDSPNEYQFPALIDSAGSAAKFAWEEFIFARIRNPYTRIAYGRAVNQFLRHCELLGRELPQISPRDVASYLDGLTLAPATKISIAVENRARLAGWIRVLLLFLWISHAVGRVACL